MAPPVEAVDQVCLTGTETREVPHPWAQEAHPVAAHRTVAPPGETDLTAPLGISKKMKTWRRLDRTWKKLGEQLLG